jgi:F420-dependent oxidoreductase-like protein
VKLSLFAGTEALSLTGIVEKVRVAAVEGHSGVWFPQRMGVDVITGLAAAAREVGAIHLGTAVVPIQGRHPIPLGQQILALAEAAGPGRVSVGLGVAHPYSSEGRFGIPYRGIVDVCEEHLTVLSALLQDRSVDFEGRFMTARTDLEIDAPAPSLLLAALGPRMVGLAGRFTDGTVTWMTGEVALPTIVARLSEAASDANRPDPRVVVGLPICITDDIERVRASLEPEMALLASQPAYARALAIEGLDHRPVDIAIVGDENVARIRLDRLRDAGATEFLGYVVGPSDDRTRTRTFLARGALE